MCCEIQAPTMKRERGIEESGLVPYCGKHRLVQCGRARYIQHGRCASPLVLHTCRARLCADDAQPSCVRQPVGSAAWFWLSKTDALLSVPWVLVPLVAKLGNLAKFALLGYFARYPRAPSDVSAMASLGRVGMRRCLQSVRRCLTDLAGLRLRSELV